MCGGQRVIWRSCAVRIVWMGGHSERGGTKAREDVWTLTCFVGTPALDLPRLPRLVAHDEGSALPDIKQSAKEVLIWSRCVRLNLND